MRFSGLWLAASILPLLVCGALPGCAREADHVAEDALRTAFPARAADVLDRGRGFERRDAGGFLTAGTTGLAGGRTLDFILPEDGSGKIELRTKRGFEIGVHEIGMAGDGEIAGNAVVYRRPFGVSFWTVTPEGDLEEWLHLDAGGAREEEVVATWEVGGAAVRARGDAVEIVDSGAVARMRVTAPVAVSASGRAVRTTLEARGSQILLRADARGEEVLIDPVWKSTASMMFVRYAHTETLLPSGKVLVTGGSSDTAPNGATAELYDPATDTWSQAASMTASRSTHTATLLGNGKVLVAGGYLGAAISGAEIYDPGSNTWSPAASLHVARYGHTATLLEDGQVLVAGGQTASAELYDPLGNTWKVASSMQVARYLSTATRLGDGRVLVTSNNGVPTKVTEIYDPAMNKWVTAAPMSIPRNLAAATILDDGRVLVTGDVLFPDPNKAEIYDPAANTWVQTGTLATAHDELKVTLLGNGEAIVTGGPTAERYDPLTDMWTSAGALVATRGWHTATLLGDGRVLLAGGHAGNIKLSSAEVSAAPGAPCVSAGDCLSGFCTDGVCCDTACGAGPCDACSVAAGAAKDGTCTLFTGPACDDSNACTQTDTCQAGVCTGAEPVACAAADPCHLAGVCDPANGVCGYAPKDDGTACDDGDACTQVDACQGGNCAGTSPIECAPLDQCHQAGACDPMTGTCSDPAKTDGSACDDGDACTSLDTCQTGTCTGGGAAPCDAVDDCHEPGACDPATGTCSSPEKPDGTACSGGTCAAGQCTSTGGTSSDTGGSSGSGGGGNGGSAGNDGGGCGCSVPGGSSTSPHAALIALCLSWMIRRRRERRRADRA